MWLPRNRVARRVVIAIALAWTVVLAALLIWSVRNEIRQTREQAAHQTRTFFQEFLLTRFWNAMHGGVYVVVDENTPPNPYLDDPLRDVTTLDGLKLTKMNPSYMTRQISHIADTQGIFSFHITSLDPIRPENKADPWETKALNTFNAGEDELFEIVSAKPDEKVFRYMGPLRVDDACLRCHGKYGAKVGDINGGISVTMPAESLIASQNRFISFLASAYFVIWFIGMAALWFSFNKIDQQEEQREIIIRKLQETLGEIKKLSGLLPICSSCKKIRDDKGYWQLLEEYISSHSEAQFSHGMCPDCANRLYPDLYKKIRKSKEE